MFVPTNRRPDLSFTAAKHFPQFFKDLFKRKFLLLFSTTSNIPFQQLLSFDIDAILPRGWGV